jgi:catalase
LDCWSIWTSNNIQNFLGDTINNFDLGYRRAHGKGICFDGTYHSNGAAALSKATVFAKSDIPAIGRFSIEAVTRMRR